MTNSNNINSIPHYLTNSMTITITLVIKSFQSNFTMTSQKSLRGLEVDN